MINTRELLLFACFALLSPVIGQQMEAPLINPLPTMILRSDELTKLEEKAYAGDGKAALRLSAYFRLSCVDPEYGDYWLRIGVARGSSDCAAEFDQLFIKNANGGPGSPRMESDARLIKRVWQAYSKKWSEAERNEVYRKLKNRGIELNEKSSGNILKK